MCSKINFTLFSTNKFSKKKISKKIKMLDAVMILRKILACYQLSLTIIGTLGNGFSIYVCTRKSMRKVSTFKLYAFSMFFDTISIYPWIIYMFYLNVIEIDLYTSDLLYCKWSNYFQYIGFEASAWFLVRIYIIIV